MDELISGLDVLKKAIVVFSIAVIVSSLFDGRHFLQDIWKRLSEKPPSKSPSDTLGASSGGDSSA